MILIQTYAPNSDHNWSLEGIGIHSLKIYCVGKTTGIMELPFGPYVKEYIPSTMNGAAISQPLDKASHLSRAVLERIGVSEKLGEAGELVEGGLLWLQAPSNSNCFAVVSRGDEVGICE